MRALTGLLLAVATATSVHAYTPLVYVETDGTSQRVSYLYWDQVATGHAIPFSISSQGTPDVELSPEDPAVDEFEALTLAFNTWQEASAGHVEFDLARTENNSYGYDGENVIFFADLGPVGYGAVTLITYENTSGRILDVDVHMNDLDIEWWTSPNDVDGEPLPCPCEGSDPAATYRNDIQGLATHEIGHVLGLDHSAVGTRESATTPTMYPRGIWGVPGDENRPANSRYRTVELDDLAGLNLFLPIATHHPATLHGVVHDRFDRPLFGAHVVARSLTTGTEIGVLSGVLEGPIDAAAYAISWLPDDTYELRVEPLVGTPPGFVGPWNFGGIAGGLLPWAFPAESELSPTYYPFSEQAADATPVVLSPGENGTAHFRPLAALERLPRFVSRPMSFNVRGRVNTELTGPLGGAWLVLSFDGVSSLHPLPVNGNPFSIPVPAKPPGTLLEIGVKTVTGAGDGYSSELHSMQIGLSGEPLLLASRVGGQTLAAVDSKTMFDFDSTERVLSFPLAQVFHRGRFAIYGTEYGSDAVSMVPLAKRGASPAPPTSWDGDGDGLLDELEPLFHTDPTKADTDGDEGLDGLEISSLYFDHPGAAVSGCDVVGAAVPAGGRVPLGRSGQLAVYDVTHDLWAAGTLILPPSGRFRMRLPAGATYTVAVWSDLGEPAIYSPEFVATADGVHVLGAIELQVPPPSQPMADPGSSPVIALDGIGLFRPDVRRIALPEGARPSSLALSPDEKFLYVTGLGTHELYKIDTRTNQVVAHAPVEGLGPEGVALSPDGTRVYVGNTLSYGLSILNASDLSVRSVIDLHGIPHQVRVVPSASLAVVAVDGDPDLVLLDTTTDTLAGGATTGLGGLFYLDTQPRHGGLVLAGKFAFGSHELAVLRLGTQELHTIDLGESVNVTAGVALHPQGRLGWAVHWSTPQLLEFDILTGTVLRTTDLPYIDTRDLLVINPRSPRAVVPKRTKGPGR